MSALLISSEWHFAVWALMLAVASFGLWADAAGPTTAAALAASKGWRSLVTPAIMCGVFGYVSANFVGVFLAGWPG